MTIGLVIPDVANSFFSDIARGTEDAAIGAGYSVILCNSDWQNERERVYFNLLKNRWVDGVIIAGCRSPTHSLERILGDLPVALVERRPVNLPWFSVWLDNATGGELATRHLLDQGCRRVAHIRGPDKSPSAAARLQGFQKAVGRQDLVVAEVVRGDYRFQSGFEAGMQLLRRADPPDGVFAGNDLMAVGFIQAAARLGVRIPEEVKVIGYDNISTTEYISPTLSTVSQPSYEMGKVAFELLNQRLQGGEHHGEEYRTEVMFRPELIVRESSKGSAVQDTAS